MDCPLCVYRRIARQALDALEQSSKLLGFLSPEAQERFLAIATRLTEEFRGTYRAEHPTAA